MTRIPLLIIVALIGCGPTIPGAAVKPKPSDPVTPAVASSTFWTDLADAVDARQIETTNTLIKVAGRAAKAKGVPFPADYDTVAAPWMHNNRRLDRDQDESLRKEVSEALRKWAK